MKKILILLLLCLQFVGGFSQLKADSLRKIINTTTVDTVKINALNKLAALLIRKKPQNALDTLQLALKMSEKINYSFGIAHCYYTYGIYYYNQQNYSQALNNFRKASTFFDKKDVLFISKCYNNIALMYYYMGRYDSAKHFFDTTIVYINLKLDNLSYVAQVYYNTAMIYNAQGDYKRAISLCIEGMKIIDRIKQKNSSDSVLYSELLTAIGNIYNDQENAEESEKYYLRAIEYLQSMNNQQIHEQLATLYENLGTVYDMKKQNSRAIEYYKKAKKVYTDLKDIAFVDCNIAMSFISSGNYDSAYYYLSNAENIYSSMNYVSGLARTKFIKGIYLVRTNRKKEAKIVLLSALKDYENIGEITKIAEISKELYLIYKEHNDYENALLMLEKFKSAQDSIFNKSNERKLAEMALTYDFEKEQTLTKLKYEHQIKQTQLRQRYTFISLVLTLIALLSFIIAFVQKRRHNNQLKLYNAQILLKNEEILTQKDEIEAQKIQIENQAKEIEKQRDLAIQRGNELQIKNNQIEASITYALKIQQSMFPQTNVLLNFFAEYAIFYRARDIVSGDFYWINEQKDVIYVAAADCTGHGVPGAFMSILGISLLNQIISENNLLKPNEILDKLKVSLIKSLNQENADSETVDGMDIAMIRYDRNRNIVEFAGAYNPLYIISSQPIEYKDAIVTHYEKVKLTVFEIKSDKMPIGIFPKINKPFSLKTIKLNKGDKLFVFSDGYADMYNTQKQQKFGTKNFKEILVSTFYSKPYEFQETLEQNYSDWLSNSRQTDDILILSLKI